MRLFLNTSFSFLPLIKETYTLCKRIQLYKYEDHPDVPTSKERGDGYWPGLRSLNLSDTEPFLFINLLHNAQTKLGLDRSLYEKINAFVHVREGQDDSKDYIHRDLCDTVIVYLSETNLESGTVLYTDDKKPLADISFFQNSAIFFDGDIFHKSKLNFGDTLENSRMTINMFCIRK